MEDTTVKREKETSIEFFCLVFVKLDKVRLY